jgi:colanic acid biosynthesis glycosyl transferase WcaI
MAHTKVLVITPQYAPDFGPSVPIYTALCEDLATMDYDVTVVTAFPHYAGSDAAYHGPRGLIAEEGLHGVRVVRTWVYTVPKAALWRRLLYHASFNLFSTLGALRVGKPAILLADAPTLWSGLPLLVFSIAGKVPFIYVVHDIYPDVMVRLGVLRNQRIANWIARLERFFYDRSAQVSVLSEGFEENLVRKGVPADKITIIPACVDVDFLQPPGDANVLRARWGLMGKFVALYAGNIGLSQGLEIVLEAAEMLLDCPDIAFVVVGEGANRANLQAQAQERHLSNVRFFPFQPREDVPLVYALADVCLVSLKRDIVVESVPSKTYTIMASGRPIVATVDPNTEVGRLLDQTGCGFCVEPEDPRALVQAVMRLYEDRLLGCEMGRCGRDFVIEHYSRQVASRGYDALIRTFANGGGR